jgi:hypothetical protein
MRFHHLLIVTILLGFVCAVPAFALFDNYNHPELKWMSFETEHFYIYYSAGLEDVASSAAEVAEEIHEPLCKLYDYRPDGKVSLIFTDDDDIANAASYFQSNKIHFYATSMAWDFRGTHNWLRNVVTHEYTHMIELGATRKWSRRVPAIYVQMLGYEAERRPDVLYGYPNRLISWPLPSVTVPAWFAEGTAQYQFNGNGYDYWDSHRDMLLRQATLSHRLLGFEDMAYFGKSSLESEGVYNQGFSFVRFIATQSGGPEVLSRISHELSSVAPVTMSLAMKRATGKSGEDWYKEWKQSLEDQYGGVRTRLTAELTKSDTIKGGGYVNLFPRLSPDGKSVAYISNQRRDYFGQTSLYVFNFDSNKAVEVAPGAHGGLAWLPDGSGILFTRRDIRLENGSLQHDIYLYRFKDKRVIRLSRGVRAEAVDVTSDGKLLAFTLNDEGRRDLALAAMPDVSGKVKPITTKDLLYRHPSLPHEQYYLPRWNSVGNEIAVAYHLKDGRGIRIFDVTHGGTGLTLKKEISGENLELRDPMWADSSNLLVSWDVSGISNIYRLNIADGTRSQLTSVLGSALYPDWRNNRLVYADFGGNGFQICRVDSPRAIRTGPNSLDDPGAYAAGIPRPSYNVTPTLREGKSYKPMFEKLYWFPRIAFDYGTFKPGTYVMVNDILEKLTFLGGFAVNTKGDYDLFGSLEYHELFPTIFADYYNIQRRLSSEFADSSRLIGEEPGFNPVYDRYRIRFRYNLNEVEGGLKIPLGKQTYAKTSVIYDRYGARDRFSDGTDIGITYFKGWAGKLGLYTDARLPGIASEINPSGGYKAFFEFSRANHNFFTGFDVTGSSIGLKQVYAPYNYDLLEGGIEKYLALPGWDHTLELRGHGGMVSNHVDPFFYQYAGGLPGMRGYSFYSLGGERTAIGTATYRFPIIRRSALNLWPVSLNRIYGGIFADVGNAWNGDFKPDRLKKDVGAGLRVQLHSFYSYPTAVAFDVAYGFDKFTVFEQDRVPTTYGKELRYYLTILFDFYSPFEGLEPGGRSTGL